MAALETYKALIDTLSARCRGVERENIYRHRRYSPAPGDERLNALVERLSSADRELLVEMLERTRLGGMHDALVVLQEFQDLHGLRLSVDGEQLKPSPLGTEMYWDLVARTSGDDWPVDR